MTKRRPSWSRWLLRAAALACGLLLLNVASPAWAAGKKLSHKAASRAVHKPVRKAPHHRTPPAEFGPADVLDDSAQGLRGKASFYGHGFQGRHTSTGERFDVRQFTAASNRFPLGTLLAVRRVDNDRCAIVKVNDRMHAKHRQRIIDVSRSVAEYLDMVRAGVVMVRIAPLPDGPKAQGDESCRVAFDPSSDCPDCARPPELPEFVPGNGG